MTEDQRIECQKILDKTVDYFWAEIRNRMLLLGESFEQARDAIMADIQSDDCEAGHG